VDQLTKTAKHEQHTGLSSGAFFGVAAGLAFVSYFVVFLMIGDGLVAATRNSFRNLIPLAIVSAAVQPIILRFLLWRPLRQQLIGHLVLGAAYALILYWLLMVLIGVAQGDSFTDFVVRAFFPTGAIAWQLLQGVTFYALVASLTYLRAQPNSNPSMVSAPAEGLPRDQSQSRYFIRKGEDIHPIEISRIVSIKGADDYAEVATLDGRHLVRMTLTEFEQTLTSKNFIRVHRSHIVNVDRVAHAEPAGGGRLLLHMEDGELIPASRAGSRLLRERVI
jgi:hypothetical protein